MKETKISTTLENDQDFFYELGLSKRVIDELKTPLILDEGYKSIIKMYCCTCNSFFSLNKRNLAIRSLFLRDNEFEELILALKDLEGIGKKYYLHAYSCPDCDDCDKDDPRIYFKEIPNH